jgi:hypothetical protein
VTSAQLTPPDVEVADVVEAAQAVGARGEQGRIDWVVREVQARLAAWLHRRALVEEVQRSGRFEVVAHSEDCRSLQARLGQQGATAEVRLVAGWPDGADVVQVAGLSGGPHGGKAEKAAGLRFEGRGLLQALEAVERELA